MIAWNSLHNWVVSANNINAFKKTLSALATSRYYIRFF